MARTTYTVTGLVHDEANPYGHTLGSKAKATSLAKRLAKETGGAEVRRSAGFYLGSTYYGSSGLEIHGWAFRDLVEESLEVSQ